MITLTELKEDLDSIDIELTPEELAWLREKYGDELAEKFARKKRIKKDIWLLMQHNTVLRALIADHKALKKQAKAELTKSVFYKAKLLRGRPKKVEKEIDREM